MKNVIIYSEKLVVILYYSFFTMPTGAPGAHSFPVLDIPNWSQQPSLSLKTLSWGTPRYHPVGGLWSDSYHEE